MVRIFTESSLQQSTFQQNKHHTRIPITAFAFHTAHARERAGDRAERGSYLHEREQQPPGGVPHGLLAVPEALDDGGDERVQVQLQVLAGEDGGGGQGLEGALADPEVAVPEEIQAAADERRRLRGGEALPGGLEELVQPLHGGQPLLRVLGARELQGLLHLGRSGGEGGGARGERQRIERRRLLARSGAELSDVEREKLRWW